MCLKLSRAWIRVCLGAYKLPLSIDLSVKGKSDLYLPLFHFESEISSV